MQRSLSLWTQDPGTQASVVTAVGSEIVVCGLSCSVACEIFPETRDLIRVSCIGRQILMHCTTRKVQEICSNSTASK